MEKTLFVAALLAILVLAVPVSGQMLESFEYGVPPPGWTKTNLLGGSGWYQMPIGVMPLPGWGNGTSSVPPTAGAGTRNAYCSWTTGGGAMEGYHSDQWLISPQLQGLTATSKLSFWLKVDFTNFPDSFLVRISTSGPNPLFFTYVALSNYYAKGDHVGQFRPWSNYVVNLGSLGIPAGTPIHIAFQEWCWDNTWNEGAMQLDVISSDLTAAPQPRANPTSLTFTAYYDGSDPGPQTFAIQSIGSSGMGFSRNTTYGAGPTNWLTLDGPSSGTLAFQNSMAVTASVSVAGLDPGTYYATHIITVPGATNSPLRIPITLNVIRRPQTMSFPNPGPQFTTNQVGLAGTSSSGLPVTFSVYSGPGVISGATNLTFTDAGTVRVIAWQLGNIYYDVAPCVTNSITVTRSVAQIAFTNLLQERDGTPRVVTASTVPAGLPVTITYDGSASAPVIAGVFTVTGRVSTTMFEGTNVATLTVLGTPQTINFPAIAGQATTNRVGLAATASSGLPVTFSISSGPGSIAGGTNLTFTGAGTVRVVAAQAGDADYAAAATTNSVVVTKAWATVTLGSLSHTYDGASHAATATTEPAGLTVDMTYDGVGTAPTAGGSYAVTGTVNDVMYQGVATDTLTIARAAQALTFPALQPQLTNAVVPLAATASSGLPVTEYEVVSGPGVLQGTNLAFSGEGDVWVAARQAGNGSWNAAPPVTNLVKAFSVNPASGVADGGNTVLVTNGRIGDGSSITNVMLCGVVATILEQGTNWVRVSAGPGTPGVGDLLIQSDQDLVVSNAYTYNPAGFIRDNALVVPSPLACGSWHSLAIKSDGSIVAWGRTNEYQCKVPAPNSGFLAVDAGNTYSLGLRGSSVIAGWGDTMAVFPPAPNTNFIGLAAGYWHALGLRADGTVTGWGGAGSSWVLAPVPNTNFVAVAAGGAHSLALKSDGSILAWGDDDSGRTNVPAPNAGFVAMSAGFAHSAGVKSDGTVVAWGANDWGQCDVPAVNTDFVAVACGGNHTLGLKLDGSIVGWGDNTYGQTAVPSPNEGFVAIAAGHFHSMGLKEDGSIVAWGFNEHGQADAPQPNADFGVASRGLVPRFGSVTGGYPVAIIGSNLCDGTDVTQVTLCGIPAQSILSQSPTQVVVLAGAAPAWGRGDVSVSSVSHGVTVKTNGFTYTKAVAVVTLGGLEQAYDGSPKTVWAEAMPTGLAVVITYNGSTSAPSAVGSYAVAGTIDDVRYAGTATGTLFIGRASQAITFPAIRTQHLTNQLGLAATASSGLPVNFAVLSGPAVLADGTNVTFSGRGLVSIVASQAGDGTWQPAPDVTNSFRTRGDLLWTDYDGDGVSDMAVYNIVMGSDYYIRRVDGGILCWQFAAEGPSPMPVPGDYNGDGEADPAAYSESAGLWWARTLDDELLMLGTNWGVEGGVPVAGDYDGDGVFDLALYDEARGNWYARTVAGQVLMVATNWGYPGAVAVPGDYDGDGVSDLAVYDDVSGNWFVRTVAGGILAMGTNWGYPGARPVPGDYDGDGVFDLAVYDHESGDWYVRSLRGPVLLWGENWGFRGAIPVPGDYNGDGVDDMAVYGMDGLAIPAGFVGDWFIRELDGDPLLLHENWGFDQTVPVNGD